MYIGRFLARLRRTMGINQWRHRRERQRGVANGHTAVVKNRTWGNYGIGILSRILYDDLGGVYILDGEALRCLSLPCWRHFGHCRSFLFFFFCPQHLTYQKPGEVLIAQTLSTYAYGHKNKKREKENNGGKWTTGKSRESFSDPFLGEPWLKASIMVIYSVLFD